MAQQLIFTSVPRGYQPGASGYCTVSRSEQMRAGLVQRLEQMSVYSHRTVIPNPTILAYRLVDLGGVKYRVISRIRDAGLDFTRRSNFIAHHLAFEPGESIGGASPAEILLFWGGWKDQWEGNPSALQDEKGDIIGSSVKRLYPPCKHWEDLTGDSGWGAFPWSHLGGCCWLHEKLDEFELLHLMGESLRLRVSGKIDDLWETSFTTYLGTITEASKYHWSAWNALDPLPAGKELGKNVIRIESLKGDPIGSKELIEIARGGHTSSSPASSIKQMESTSKEVKAQAKGEAPIKEFQRRDSITKAIIPNAKNKQNYLPALLVAAAVAIIAVAYIFHKKASKENQKQSDAELIACINSISENLSGHHITQQDQNYNSGLMEKQLMRIRKKERDSIRELDQSVRDLISNKTSDEMVLKSLNSFQNTVTNSEATEKTYSLRKKINQFLQEKKTNERKQYISKRIDRMLQNDVIDVDRDLNELMEMKKEWNQEISRVFPFEDFLEITALRKQLNSSDGADANKYSIIIERLKHFTKGSEAAPYALRVIEDDKEEKELFKKLSEKNASEKLAERIDVNHSEETAVPISPDTKKYESQILDSLLTKNIRENIMKEFPTASVSYILEENIVCPNELRESEDIAKYELSNYKTTTVKKIQLFDEKGFLKGIFREQSKSGLVLILKKKDKVNILIYRLDKPWDLLMSLTDQSDIIYNELEGVKSYLENSIIPDSKVKRLQWNVSTTEAEKSFSPNIGFLRPEEIHIIYNASYNDKKEECLREFRRLKNSITLNEIESRWLKQPAILSLNTIKNTDQAVIAFLDEKDKLDKKSASVEYSGLGESQKTKKIKQNVERIIKENCIWSDKNDPDKKARKSETLDQLGEAIKIQVQQIREYLFINSVNDVTQIKRQDYEVISTNKLNLGFISAWEKYQKYIETKQSGDQPQPQKEYEWLVKNVLLNGGEYRLYLCRGEVKYFQIIAN